jgi:hypothetical protein
LQTLPYPASDPSHPNLRQLSERCKDMFQLHEQLAEARTGQERSVYGARVSRTDRQINRLVYELYGLTDKEIAIVEDAVAS